MKSQLPDISEPLRYVVARQAVSSSCVGSLLFRKFFRPELAQNIANIDSQVAGYQDVGGSELLLATRSAGALVQLI